MNCPSVRRNSLRGTFLSNEPPTKAPSAILQVLFVSPTQPRNVLPSESGRGAARDEITEAANARTMLFIREPDDSIPQFGMIGFQVHGGGAAEASYKDITIEVLS